MSYQELSVADKIRYHRERMREPAMRCPACGIAVQPDDLLAHVEERCEGMPEPHPHSKWVTWGEALEQGIANTTLHHLVSSGRVRTKGRRRARRYLLRDIALFLSRRAGATSKNGSATENTDEGLTFAPDDHPRGDMARKPKSSNKANGVEADAPSNGHVAIPPGMAILDADVRDRLVQYVEGHGVAATARQTKIPEKTLRTAMEGKPQRQGTVFLTTMQVRDLETR